MAYPIVTGAPDYSSTGPSKFIPEIWSGKLLVKYYAATVMAAISNTDYEGEIKEQGSKVIIRTIPSITIRKHAKGQKLTYERPESPPVELEIDRGQYFAFVCDDIDKYQSDLKLMDDWAKDASEQMKIVIDTEVLAELPLMAHDSNQGLTAGASSGDINLGVLGTPLAIAPETDTGEIGVVDLIVDAGICLDELNVPESDRWMVIPPWFAGMIKKSELKDASITGDGVSMLRNGRIGRIDRFTLYTSNNLDTVTDTKKTYEMPFGHKAGLTFASQMTQMDTLKAESTFGQLVRGLNVYGFNVLKPECIGWIHGQKA